MTPFEIAMILGIGFVSLASSKLGEWVRERVHVIYPWKDPLSAIIMVIVLGPAISTALSSADIPYISAASEKLAVIDPGNTWYVLALFIFMICYLLSYIRNKDDDSLIYVDVHTIISDSMPNGGQEIYPIMWYERNGELFLQEQSLKSILKALIFGVRSPLRFPLGQIERTRPVSVNMAWYPSVAPKVVDVVERTVEETEVKRWRFTFKQRSYVFTPAPDCCDEPYSYLVNATNYQAALSSAARNQMRMVEMQTTYATQSIARAGDILTEFAAHSPGNDLYEEIARDLEPTPNARGMRDAIDPIKGKISDDEKQLSKFRRILKRAGGGSDE